MKAWIENGAIREVASLEMLEHFTAEIAALFDTDVPDSALPGDTLVDGEWVHPAPPEPVEPVPPVIKLEPLSRVQFKLLFTATERVTMKKARASDELLDDFYDILEDVSLDYVDMELQSTKDSINYLAYKGYIQADRVDEILTGVFK